MARSHRKQMADMRAMAVQHERTEMDGRRPSGAVDVLVGGGATPSMGLDPYWGGSMVQPGNADYPVGLMADTPPYYRHGAMEPLEENVNHPPELFVGGSAVQPGSADYPVGLMADTPPYYRHGAMEPLEENVNHPPELFVGGYRDDEPLPVASGSLKRLKGGAKHAKLGNSEAFTMGHHLGKHLHTLHGGDFYSDFSKGYSKAGEGGHESGEYDGKGFTPSEVRKAKRLAKLHGGAWYDFLDPAKNGLNASVADTKAKFEEAGKKVKNEFVNPQSKLRGELLPKLAHELSDPDSDFRSKIIPQYAEPVINALAPGMGTAVKVANEVARKGQKAINPKGTTWEQYKSPGFGKGYVDPTPPTKRLLGREGKGRKPKCPSCGKAKCVCVKEEPKEEPVHTMSGGGRGKRADVVKRVMAQKGMKMIEASKYVKAHGLY